MHSGSLYTHSIARLFQCLKTSSNVTLPVAASILQRHCADAPVRRSLGLDHVSFRRERRRLIGSEPCVTDEIITRKTTYYFVS